MLFYKYRNRIASIIEFIGVRIHLIVLYGVITCADDRILISCLDVECKSVIIVCIFNEKHYFMTLYHLACGGTCKEYDPFLIAERQMNDLLSDSSDLSLTEIPSTSSTKSHFPLSHSSAFVKYPYQCKNTNHLDKSITNELDELTSDFSSDSTETNSISREMFVKEFHDDTKKLIDRGIGGGGGIGGRKSVINKELNRRMILDKSIVLGGSNDINRNKSIGIDKQYKNDISNKILDKGSSLKISRPQSNKSQTAVRAYSAPKSIYQRKISQNSNTKDNKNEIVQLSDNNIKNDYLTFSSSDLSLNSIVSSDIDMKRSNFVFDQLITSYDDDDDDNNIVGNDSFPSLRSLLRNESLRTSSNGPNVITENNSQFNGLISDEEFSSTDNYKQLEHKINADSAYSRLILFFSFVLYIFNNRYSPV
ncbi:hypothetical protein M0802_007864 [Mischocyttarus mexicanus]|nr:hypothetical protein M0802_007864 [Mischocyttarus mexicanus]